MASHSGQMNGSRDEIVAKYKNEWLSLEAQLKQSLVLEDETDFDVEDLKLRRTIQSNGRLTVFHAAQPSTLRFVGGMDISFFSADENSLRAAGAFVVLSFPDLQVVYDDIREIELAVPYVPSYLAHREASAMISFYERYVATDFGTCCKPQVILYDGNGVLHPREFGCASFVGVSIGTPVIGVAKKFFQIDGIGRDDAAALVSESNHEATLVGASGKHWGKARNVLIPTPANKKPIYVSIGHRVSLATAVKVVRECCCCRIPEPIRQADLRSREFVRKREAAAATH